MNYSQMSKSELSAELEKLFSSGEPYVIDEIETFIKVLFIDLQAYTFSLE